MEGGRKSELMQPHPFAGTLAQKANKFTLPWVRDDQKKPSGGRGSSINIEELAKPLEQGAGVTGGAGGPFSNRTHFKYQKAPVVIPFISLKNFKKTNENLVAPSSESEKSKLKKQQSDLIQQLTSPPPNSSSSDPFSPPPPSASPIREEEDDVSDLLDELESVKVRYQEGLKKKIESEAIENARRSQEQHLNRSYPRQRSKHDSTSQEDHIREIENRLEIGDMTVLFDNSIFKFNTGSNGEKIQLDEEDLEYFEQVYETELLPEMKELHKEELYKVHLALKDVVKEKEVLGKRMKKLKKLRPRVRANKKEWMEQEIAESLKDIEENGFASVDALKRDVARVVRLKYGDGRDVVHDQFKEYFDEMAVGVSLSPTIPLRRKVATLVFATLQFNNFMEEYPDYDNATQLKLEEEEDRLRMEEFVQEAPILHDVAFHYEKTGHLEFPDDGEEGAETFDDAPATRSKH